jgi:2-dehydro-3-deoxyphosphogluconate aldolase/(4S)-4-hydroxy-2-oxoglutarate aldolase
VTGHAAVLRIREVGLIPIIRTDSDETAIKTVDALVGAGLTVVEITMTVPNALGAMALVAKRFGSRVLLGAGTVTTPGMANAAIDAGCEFLVTPCFLPSVIACARRRQVPIVAGAFTPTEIFMAHEAGADLVKVFPVLAAGGPAYVRALKGPFPRIDLVPTGGVNRQSVGEYIKAGAAAVGVGSELVPRTAVTESDFEAIGSLGRQFLDAIRDARGV